MEEDKNEELSKEVLKGKKPQGKVEMFLVKPNYSPLFGLTVTKDTDIDDIESNGEIHQTIKDLVLTTSINKKFSDTGLEFEEKSEVKVKLNEGTRLLWMPGKGYILPGTKPVTRKEIIEELKCLDGIEGLE